MPQLKSVGKLSTEGNEAGNRRFKNEKSCILLLVAFKVKWNNPLDLNEWQLIAIIAFVGTTLY